jgi:hypothetical protein
MTPQQFIAKWKPAMLSERSAYQQHFLDLCELLGQQKPADADPEGTHYTFERGVHQTDGSHGWADVWKLGYFGWEYKGKHKDLKSAYQQLLRYREDLNNPPLLVVCDLDRFEVHTNFTGTAKQVHAFDLDGLGDPANLDVLRKVFSAPNELRPGKTTQAITEEIAEQFAMLADRMRARKVPAEQAAPFLMKLMFCMFAEDIGLLPNQVFRKLLQAAKQSPKQWTAWLGELFAAMEKGGFFWGEHIEHFNGGLFADSKVVDLTPGDIDELILANLRRRPVGAVVGTGGLSGPGTGVARLYSVAASRLCLPRQRFRAVRVGAGPIPAGRLESALRDLLWSPF